MRTAAVGGPEPARRALLYCGSRIAAAAPGVTGLGLLGSAMFRTRGPGWAAYAATG